MIIFCYSFVTWWCNCKHLSFKIILGSYQWLHRLSYRFDHWLAKATCGLVQWTSICRSWIKAYRKISQAWQIACFNYTHMPQSGEMIRENLSQMNIINFDQDKFIYIWRKTLNNPINKVCKLLFTQLNVYS